MIVVTAEYIWAHEVPRRGQATTVRGELLRAVEKLRDESQRNANLNWSDQHGYLVAFLREHLSGVTPAVGGDLDQISDYERPVTSDEPYDRLVDAVVAWAAREPAPAAHEHNPQLIL